MRVGEVGRWIGQGVRLKPRGRDESPDESERARDDLSDTETTSGPGDRGDPSLRSKSILLTEVLVVGSMETERGGGEGTYPDDMGEQANVGPRSKVPSELIKEAERPRVPL